MRNFLVLVVAAAALCSPLTLAFHPSALNVVPRVPYSGRHVCVRILRPGFTMAAATLTREDSSPFLEFRQKSALAKRQKLSAAHLDEIRKIFAQIDVDQSGRCTCECARSLARSPALSPQQASLAHSHQKHGDFVCVNFWFCVAVMLRQMYRSHTQFLLAFSHTHTHMYTQIHMNTHTQTHMNTHTHCSLCRILSSSFSLSLAHSRSLSVSLSLSLSLTHTLCVFLSFSLSFCQSNHRSFAVPVPGSFPPSRSLSCRFSLTPSRFLGISLSLACFLTWSHIHAHARRSRSFAHVLFLAPARTHTHAQFESKRVESGNASHGNFQIKSRRRKIVC